MKYSVIKLLVLLLVVAPGFSQVKYETINSEKLGESRAVKIQLPRGYDNNKDKAYPLIVVLDGDYLFEPVAGNVDFYSYWEDMPESIVIGINQVDSRYDDCLYSGKNSLPIEKGAAFFEFLGMELIPYIQKKYRTVNFRTVIGHGDTANFINYYLLKPDPLFQAYISISPELAPNMLDYLSERLSKIQTKTFYHLASTINDSKSITQMTNALNESIRAIDNDNLIYTFDSVENASHYSIPAHIIPKALEKIFFVFQPISKKEFQETILKLEDSPVTYLKDKYEMINNLFAIEKQILVNDFKAIAAAIEKNGTFEYYEELGKLARDHYPKTLLGNYYLARYYEETGEPKKAYRTYQSAFILNEIGGVTKDLVISMAQVLKDDFGYN